MLKNRHPLLGLCRFSAEPVFQMTEKYHTYLITLSVPGDIDRECYSDTVQYLCKKCSNIFAVIEMSNKLHFHATVCFRRPIAVKHIKETLWDIVKKYHPDAVRKHAIDVHVQYNHTWKDSYLIKDDSRKVLVDRYNHEEVSAFFPTAEQQSALIRVTETRVGDHALEPFWQKLLTGWTDHTCVTTYESALEYLRYRMYVTYESRIIRDPRTLCQMADVLRRLRTKDISPSAEDIRWYNQQIGNVL